jgi:hypothetical protein
MTPSNSPRISEDDHLAADAPVLGGDDHSVGRVQQRLVLIVPPDAVVLVTFAAEQLDDLPVSRPLTVQVRHLDPVAYMCAAGCVCVPCGHLFTSWAI